MKKILFDTNIILDIALKREPFFEHAFRLFELIDRKVIDGYITASTITDIYYISKKEKGHNTSLQFIRHLTNVVDVIGVNKEVILDALDSKMNDFEDAVQSSAAKLNNLDIIITRNKNDFIYSTIEINTPEEFLLSLNPL